MQDSQRDLSKPYNYLLCMYTVQLVNDANNN